MKQSPPEPYTLANWLLMKPGSLVMGYRLYPHEGIGLLASEWYCGNERYKASVERNGWTSRMVSENVAHWRRDFPSCRKVGNGVCLYQQSIANFMSNTGKLNEVEFADCDGRNLAHVACSGEPDRGKFEYGLPIGIFMGHVVQIGRRVYVNLLTANYGDIWL